MIELGAIFFLGPKGSLLVHLSVQSECTLGCTSCGVINDRLFSNKSFKRNYIKINAAKYLCKFYAKVWTWYDMTKGLKVLAWMHPRSKLIECNPQKDSLQWLYF